MLRRAARMAAKVPGLDGEEVVELGGRQGEFGQFLGEDFAGVDGAHTGWWGASGAHQLWQSDEALPPALRLWRFRLGGLAGVWFPATVDSGLRRNEGAGVGRPAPGAGCSGTSNDMVGNAAPAGGKLAPALIPAYNGRRR